MYHLIMYEKIYIIISSVKAKVVAPAEIKYSVPMVVPVVDDVNLNLDSSAVLAPNTEF